MKEFLVTIGVRYESYIYIIYTNVTDLTALFFGRRHVYSDQESSTIFLGISSRNANNIGRTISRERTWALSSSCCRPSLDSSRHDDHERPGRSSLSCRGGNWLEVEGGGTPGEMHGRYRSYERSQLLQKMVQSQLFFILPSSLLLVAL